jgi:hypothetical protein
MGTKPDGQTDGRTDTDATRAAIANVGLERFSASLTYAMEHVASGAYILESMNAQRKQLIRTRQQIKRWRDDCGSKANDVPAAIKPAVQAVYEATASALLRELQAMADEITLVSFDDVKDDDIAS